jgi:hypothetical protein
MRAAHLPPICPIDGNGTDAGTVLAELRVVFLEEPVSRFVSAA